MAILTEPGLHKHSEPTIVLVTTFLATERLNCSAFEASSTVLRMNIAGSTFLAASQATTVMGCLVLAVNALALPIHHELLLWQAVHWFIPLPKHDMQLT